MEFLKGYHKFILENMDQAKSIMKRKAEEFESLKSLLSNNLGYIGKFTQYLIEENIPYNELEKIYKDIIDLKSKSQNIDISNLKYEKLLDKIQTVKEDLIIKEVTNQFPSEQKGLIKNLEGYYERDFRSLCLKISKKDNLKNFISKISRYKSLDNLISSMKVFAKSENNSIESVKELISKSQSKIILDRDKVLIIMVPSFEEIKIFGSDTSWCIISSNSMWDKYAKGRYQFVLYDYNREEHDPKFKIGFTVEKYGNLYAAHDILDDTCSSHLKEILNSINIKLIDLVPKIEPVDISTLKRNAKNEDLLEIFNRCEISEIPTAIQSLLKWTNKSESFRIKSILRLLNRLFNEKDFILKSDLELIDKNLPNYILRMDNSIGGKFVYPKFASKLSDKALKEGIKIWNDQEFLDSINDMISSHSIDYYKKYASLLQPISDRLNKIYSNNEFGKMSDNIKSRLEIYMLIMNYKLNRGTKTPNHNHIVKSLPSWAKDDHAKILNIKLDLNEFASIPDSIDQIIKKDYPEKKFEIYVNNLYKSLFLADHLDGHVLNFKIDKKSIKDILSGDRPRWISSKEEKYDLKEDNKLMNLIGQLSGKRKWAEAKDGNLSIQICG